MLKFVKIEKIDDDEFFIRKITAEKTFVEEAWWRSSTHITLSNLKGIVWLINR